MKEEGDMDEEGTNSYEKSIKSNRKSKVNSNLLGA